MHCNLKDARHRASRFGFYYEFTRHIMHRLQIQYFCNLLWISRIRFPSTDILRIGGHLPITV